MTARVALHLNAVVGLASALAAGAMMSLVLTRPEAVVSAVAEGGYGALAGAVAAQLAGWVQALLRYL
jgi:hypothetical protein